MPTDDAEAAARRERMAAIAAVEQTEFDHQAWAVKYHWAKRGELTTLSGCHALLTCETIARILREDMQDFCLLWRRSFPLRDPFRDPLVGSIFVFPHLDEPRLVERARREVLAALRSGVFAGTGLDANQPLKPRASIPADSWPSFDVDFEASEISTGRAVFRDVRITVVETRGKRPAPVRFSEDAARKWFRERVHSWPEGGTPPSEDDDLRAYAEKFGHSAPRGKFRDVRRSEVPAEWMKRGPHGPRRKISPK